MTSFSCGACRAVLLPGSRFCEHCGTQVDRSTAAGDGPAPPPADWSHPSATRAGSPAAALGRDQQQNGVTGSPYDWGDPLVGSAVPNETYLGNRLQYSDQVTSFDPLTNQAWIRGMTARFLAFLPLWWVGAFVLFLLFGVKALVDLSHYVDDSNTTTFGSFGESQNTGSTTFLAVWFWLTVVWSLVLTGIFWFTKISTQLTEWMLTLDGKGRAALPALEHMYAIIVARRPPLTDLKVVRLSPGRQAPREYLQATDGNYVGFVSSFAYGADLFIGWTFWLSLSPAKWLFMTLTRMVRGSGTGLYGALIFDQPKAMREVLHSAVRQGVDVATGDVGATGQGELGTSVPFTSIRV